MEAKRCSNCKEEKSVEEFSRDKSTASGLAAYCRPCNAARTKEYREKNKGKLKASQQKHYKENRAKLLEQKKEYYQKNHAEITEKITAYREKNREEIRRRGAIAYYALREKRLEAKKRQYQRHKKAMRERHRQWTQSESGKKWLQRYWENTGKEARRARNLQRWKTDVQYKLSEVLRNRLYSAIRNKQKRGSAVRDLGCSVASLVAHIENQFSDGMAWENWGTVWQLDHIYPMAKADLENRAELLAVCNWRNLQPLTVEENLSKNDKVTPAARRLFRRLCKEFAEHADGPRHGLKTAG